MVTGTPRISITVGVATRYADYNNGDGTTTLEFIYTVQSGDNDGDGIGVTSAISLNGGSLKDASGNNADLTFAGLTTTES